MHLRPYDEVRAVAEGMLGAGGQSGRPQIQISENVPRGVWRTSLPVIVDATDAYGAIWGGGPVGRVFTQLAYWGMQLRDRLDERASR